MPANRRLERALPTAPTMMCALAALAFLASTSYTVREGDTLSEIASAHGTTIDAIAEANELANPHLVRAGERLRLPASVAAVEHTVAPGEHLTAIAARYGVRLPAVVRANGIADPDLIRIGDRLRIPRAPPASRLRAAGAYAPRGEVEAILERTARAHGWNPAFVKAVAWQESGWSNEVVSPAGAVGIMQVLPETGDFVSRHLAGRPLDLTDPGDNVLAGVLFLDHLYGLTGRDAELTLAGYYQGLRSVRERGLFLDTERYVANVLALRDRFG